uniref:Uncharacterized protein n=1 Tax=Panagrolaimus davidi TaxID=227884 RepID=A0A914Q9G0_9BILA
MSQPITELKPLKGKVARTFHEFAKRRKITGTFDKSEYDGPLDSYLLVKPSKTIERVDSPPIIPLRFTHNGKMMIAAMDQPPNQLIIYRYMGVETLAGVKPNDMFYTIFKHLHMINIDESGRNYRLHKDALFLLEDDDFLITFSSAPVLQLHNNNNNELESVIVPSVPLASVQQNNETPRQALEAMDHYIFHVVSLKTGKVVHKIELEYHWLISSHCIYLRKRTFIVLSIHHQTLYIYNVTKDGKLELITDIGEFTEPPDQRLSRPGQVSQAFTGMKQLLLKSLFEFHKNDGNIQQFFQLSHLYRSLKMVRMQMLDDDIILIRWAQDDVIRSEQIPQPPPGPIYFTFFKWKTSEIIGIYGPSSTALLEIYEKCNESFRYGFLTKNERPITMEFCTEPKRMHEIFKKNYRNKNGSEQDLCRKLLSQLPCSMSICPAFSPFLDPKLFNYDEKIIAAIERGRVPCDMKIR